MGAASTPALTKQKKRDEDSAELKDVIAARKDASRSADRRLLTTWISKHGAKRREYDTTDSSTTSWPQVEETDS